MSKEKIRDCINGIYYNSNDITGMTDSDRKYLNTLLDQLPDVSEQDLKLLEDIKAEIPEGHKAVGFRRLSLGDKFLSSNDNVWTADIALTTTLSSRIILEKIHKEPELEYINGVWSTDMRKNDSDGWRPIQRLKGQEVIIDDIPYDLILCRHAVSGNETVLAGHWNDGPLNSDGEVENGRLN